MSSQHFSWSCKCGEIQAKLSGEPLVNLACHCHSCVATARFIEEKTNQSDLSSLKPNGGVNASLWAVSQIDFTNDLSDSSGVSKIPFVRVGEKGIAVRCYTKCCGTQMANCVLGGVISFNRSGLKNEDGSPFQPEEILNLNKKHAFDPSAVPESSHETVPLSVHFKVLFTAMNPFSKRVADKAFFPEADDILVVPITWE